MNAAIPSPEKVSVIVPVYNAERFISSCIDSILNQTYSNLELILVIDGSPDNSAEICHEYGRRDSRIHVLEKENGGAGSARNAGISKAAGDYICFVDADDEIAPDMIEKMMGRVVETHADLCICGFEVQGSGLILNDTKSLRKLQKAVSKEKLILSIIDTSQKRIFGYAWRCLYKRKVITANQIFFPETIKISEDYMFFLNFSFHADTICILPEELYYYKINGSSATAKYMPSLHSDMRSVNDWMKVKICPEYPSAESGYHCCEANTYLRTVQNLCRRGNPYTLAGRIKEAYKIKKRFGYEAELQKALNCSKDLSLKNIVSYCALFLFQEWLYLILFSVKIRLSGQGGTDH